MENSLGMNTPMPPVTPGVDMSATPKSDHWLVEVTGGVTLASTIVSASAMFLMFMWYGPLAL